MKSAKRQARDTFFLIIGLCVIGWSFYIFLQKPAPEKYQAPFPINKVLQVGDSVFEIEIADEDSERARGLSGREALAEGSGLFFIFENPGLHGFWMYDMRFAIDIVWISESWSVVGIEKNVDPNSFPKIYYPTEPVKYVLELPAGTAEERGIDTRAKVYFIDRN